MRYLILIIFLLGCNNKYTSDKALKDVIKADTYHPATVADFARKHYPCILRDADTVVKVKDSIIMVDCPELPEIINVEGRTDTILHIVKVPIKIAAKYITITKYIEDSAKIKVLSSSLIGANERIEDLKADNNDLTIKLIRKGKTILWLIISLLGMFILSIFIKGGISNFLKKLK